MTQSQTPSTGPTRLLLIAGWDPACASGLGRDVFTAARAGAIFQAIPTCFTDQDGTGVHHVEARDGAAVEAEVRRVLAREPVAAVKVGLLATADVARAVAAGLAGYGGPVVVDPVLSASRGGALFQGDPSALLAMAAATRAILTPNAAEAAALSGRPVADRAQAEAAARAIYDHLVERAPARTAASAATAGAWGPTVLVKGGHLAGGATDPVASADDRVDDILVWPAGVRHFASARRPGPSPRGTGCALSTLLAVALAREQPLPVAIAWARQELDALRAAAVPVGDEWHLPR